MYTISDKIYQQYIKMAQDAVKDQVEEDVIPATVLSSTFKVRMKQIFDKIRQAAGMSNPFYFIGGKNAHSTPLASGDNIYFGVGFNQLPDGAIAAIAGHELGHFAVKSDKRKLENLITAAGKHGSPNSLEDLKRTIASIDPLRRKLAEIATATEDNYLREEIESDKLGVQWALKAGFTKEEVRAFTTIFSDEVNRKRIKLIEDELDRSN